MKSIKYLTVVVFVWLLTACGGGSPEGVTGGGNSASGTAAVVVSFVNADGASVNSIALDGGYSVQARLTDKAGGPVAGKTVTFRVTDSNIALLTPETNLTNASGVASVAISPASVSSIGAATVTASATVDAAPVTGSRDFSVQATNITLSPLRVGSASLNSGGNTSVAVTALIAGNPASGTPVNISFSASCGRINEKEGSVTTDGSGVARAVYTAVQVDGSPCSGSTTLSANTAGAAAVTASVNVAAPIANAITFVSASPQQVFIAGSGAVEQAQVKFKVFSASATPLANQAVVFSIETNPGGVGLNASDSLAPVMATTNSNGEVSVTVFAGTIPGPVKVRASLPNTSVFAESQNMTVASGPPSQRFFSLSVETFNIEGANRDGTATELTVRVADRQGNAVEDGTIINFTTEGGQVARSCATTRANNIASCSVTFVSQDHRPSNGRVSVLAYAEGTKDYIDNNGDNKFGPGDTLINIGHAFRDDNENGAYDAEGVGEFVLPRSGNKDCQGAGAPAPAVANTCDLLLATTVRKQTVLMFSSSQPAVPSQYFRTAAGDVLFRLGSRNNPLLPMPAGTTVTASVVDNTPGNGLSCSSPDLYGSPVVNVPPGSNPNADLATEIVVSLKDCAAGDSVTFKVTSPTKITTTLPLLVL